MVSYIHNPRQFVLLLHSEPVRLVAQGIMGTERLEQHDRCSIDCGECTAPRHFVELLEVLSVDVRHYALVTMVHYGEWVIGAEQLRPPPASHILEWREPVAQTEDMTKLVGHRLYLIVDVLLVEHYWI